MVFTCGSLEKPRKNNAVEWMWCGAGVRHHIFFVIFLKNRIHYEVDLALVGFVD